MLLSVQVSWYDFYKSTFIEADLAGVDLIISLVAPFPMWTSDLTAVGSATMLYEGKWNTSSGGRTEGQKTMTSKCQCLCSLRETYTCIRYTCTLAIFTYQFSMFQIPPTYPLQTSCSLIFFSSLSRYHRRRDHLQETWKREKGTLSTLVTVSYQ